MTKATLLRVFLLLIVYICREWVSTRNFEENLSDKMSWTDALQHATDLARRAVNYDKAGKSEAASYFYLEAAGALEELDSSGHALPPGIVHKISEYKQRADLLKKSCESCVNPVSLVSSQQQDVERAKFLLVQALDADESGKTAEAVNMYIDAVELCREAMKSTSKSEQKDTYDRLTTIALKALDRAESLKGVQNPTRSSQVTTVASNTSAGPSITESMSQLKVSGASMYTAEEKSVLAATSLINGRQYLPFMKGDLQERFAFPITFTDKDGTLALSPKQKLNFARWARPQDVCPEPKIIESVDCFHIKQTIVSDCSFVASLAVAAQYERTFKKRLITKIIFPQNKKGDPVYNPCGKFMVKLNLNGIPRKVIIDDFVPVGKSGELLCSYSSNKGELWVSLLEKAYMKVMGGYDFPGSNSNIDLHALTGWIPERIAIRPKEPEFDSDKVFRKLYDRFHKGDVLATVATGELSKTEADRAGLVPTHAYALLNIQEIKGVRLFMLKNPWSHLRWRGNYSELDSIHWTDELKKRLNYDPKSAAAFDNGIFWIDYDSLCRFFDVFYLNWNPALFSHTSCIHAMWQAGTGPVRDMYNIGENPQYCLEVEKSHGAAVWILLTRHITEIEDFQENKEYITVVVYKGGKRIYYPYDPPPYVDGIRINSPHYLCKLVLNHESSSKFTLVISQYEKMNTIYYSLRIYATCPFQLNKLQTPYKYKIEKKDGLWQGITAGGCGNYPATYVNNPKYQLTLENKSDLLIELKGPKQYQVGFDVICVSTNGAAQSFAKKSSGAYRSGFVILVLDNVPAGIYRIVPSTFNPGQEGPFFLTVSSTNPCQLTKL